MTFDEIKALVAKGESRTLELKKTTGELKDGMKSACAFLNSDGGWLIFGITPTSLRIIGQQVTDATQCELAQALAKFEPAIKVDVEYINIPESPDNQVIVIYFNPFTPGTPPATFDGRAYYKLESTTSLMPRAMFEERLRLGRPRFYAWERQPAEEALKIEDLDANLIRGVVRLGVERKRLPELALAEPIENVLSKLKLLTDGVPNNAAAALFTTKPWVYSQFTMRMARFRGLDKNEFIDNMRVEGNFFQLLDAGMSFFFKHLSLSGKIVGLRREERLEVPIEALRETLTNALCHRQYENYKLTIGLAIYDDRIEIANPGIFPPPITPETIKLTHDSYPYNQIIANVLFKTTYIESWGSGAKRIMDACKAQNAPMPTWNVNGSFVTVTFKRPNVGGIKSELKTTNKTILKTVLKTTPKTVPKTEGKILQLLKENPALTIDDLGSFLNISRSGILWNIKKLKERGLLRHVGPRKGGHWEVVD